MKNKKIISIGIIATLAVIGLGSSILISGNAKNKEIEAIEQKSTESETESHAVEEEMTSITLEKELKEHEKEFTDAGYTLETEGLVNKYTKLRRFGNNIEVSIEKTIEYLDDLASADEALNKLGEETDTKEADKAAEVKEQVQTEQKNAEQTKEVYEGSKSNTTTTQNTAPVTPAPADTNDINVQEQEKAASSSSSDVKSLEGTVMPDGSVVGASGTDAEVGASIQQEMSEAGRTW